MFDRPFPDISVIFASMNEIGRKDMAKTGSSQQRIRKSAAFQFQEAAQKWIVADNGDWYSLFLQFPDKINRIRIDIQILPMPFPE